MNSDHDQTELSHVGRGEGREGTRCCNKEAKDTKGLVTKMSGLYREESQGEGIPYPVTARH